MTSNSYSATSPYKLEKSHLPVPHTAIYSYRTDKYAWSFLFEPRAVLFKVHSPKTTVLQVHAVYLETLNCCLRPVLRFEIPADPPPIRSMFLQGTIHIRYTRLFSSSDCGASRCHADVISYEEQKSSSEVCVSKQIFSL